MIGIPCGKAKTDLDFIKVDVTKQHITFRDGAGVILGTATTGTGDSVTLGGNCTYQSTYSLSVPEADFYAISVAAQELDPLSLEEMKSNGWIIAIAGCAETPWRVVPQYQNPFDSSLC